MRKRNFEDDEDEDYQDGGQPLDDKPEPSPRVTRYNLRVTTSGPQNRNNEQAQEETNDATFEDNTTVRVNSPFSYSSPFKRFSLFFSIH